MGPQTRRLEAALDVAAGVLAFELEGEERLRGDDVAFHADDFLDARQAAAAIFLAFDLQHDIDRSRNLRAQTHWGNFDTRHRDHVFDSGQRVPRCVRVDRRQ